MTISLVRFTESSNHLYIKLPAKFPGSLMGDFLLLKVYQLGRLMLLSYTTVSPPMNF